MNSIMMLGTPGCPVSGGIALPYALVAKQNAVATLRPRGNFGAPTMIIADDRRSVLERSP